MHWSYRLGKVAGIDVYMHLTFLLLVAWQAYESYQRTKSVEGALAGVGFILTLFGIVVLHELGHALAARRYGIQTRDITLLPIGGVARLERMPEDPKQELVVALAGPAVNVVLAVLLYPFVAGSIPTSLESGQAVEPNFLMKLFAVNVVLAVFNLVPAFPMDGGRVLRALLAMRMDYVRATQIAATIGQGMAFLLGLWGLSGGGPMLLFIAVFVWIGATQESAMVQMNAALAGIPVMRAMVTNLQTLDVHDSLAHAVELVVGGFQHDFPVLDDGKVVGMLSHPQLLTVLSAQGPGVRVGDVMRSDCAVADPREMLDSALSRLREQGCRAMPVVSRGQLVGLLTTDNLSDLVMIRDALRQAPRIPAFQRH